METLAAVTNTDFAKLIGMTHSHVSRLRAGHRLPSIDTMIILEKELKWPIGQQILSRRAETYAADLEEQLRRKYGILPDEPTPS